MHNVRKVETIIIVQYLFKKDLLFSFDDPLKIISRPLDRLFIQAFLLVMDLLKIDIWHVVRHGLDGLTRSYPTVIKSS